MKALPFIEEADGTVGEEVSLRDEQEVAPLSMVLGSVWLMSRCDLMSAGNIKDSTPWKMSRMVIRFEREQGHKWKVLCRHVAGP